MSTAPTGNGAGPRVEPGGADLGLGVSVSPAISDGPVSVVSERGRRRSPEPSVEELAAGVVGGDRAMLGRAISMIESTHPSRIAQGRELLRRLATGREDRAPAVRVGITGVPGAGKSTFIERLGVELLRHGRRVGVLAVDPSSSVSGGAILGDKTRMAALAADARAFIRPSPSAGALGGVTRTTRESIVVCEAAGFDVMLVETVGVGQSETAVSEMTDVFVALMVPGAGDELQGIKRGLLELVDVLAINKCDGDNAARARLAARQYAGALRMLRGDSGASGASGRPQPTVLTCSALSGEGVWEVWQEVAGRHARLVSNGELWEQRRWQDQRWLHALIQERLRQLVLETPGAAQALADAEAEVRAGIRPPMEADEAVVRAVVRTQGREPN